MANTFKKIQTVSLDDANASSMVFTNIPATYDDLYIKVSARTDRTGYTTDLMTVTLTGGTNTVYSNRFEGNGSSVTTSLTGGTLCIPLASTSVTTAGIYGSGNALFTNYAKSNPTFYKSFSAYGVNEHGATGAQTGWQVMYSAVVIGSAPITQIALTPNSGTNFIRYSSATLYGITRS